MNSWPNEFMAECHRQRILEEVEQIHLERLALKSRVYRSRFFGWTMFNFGNWLISTGKRLRKRYEIPDGNYSTSPIGGTQLHTRSAK